ncbi:MAG: tRNA lysidine(34) synthetase TilS, partial [Burkholderiaceae bacterium]|nr:tRNA lysidine(34) synthetase TilS [Burkholderiaceae bacterium]
MASSRKRPQTADPLEAALLAAVRAAVQAALDDGIADRPIDAGPRGRRRIGQALALAFSGGRDSTALLDLAVRLRQARARGFRELLAVHVHHGLQRQADAWVEHCRALCERLQVPLVVRRVSVDRRGRGPEAAAREARYAALADAAREHGARLLLTAHHLDDRLETFLIQWLRGAGPEGLAGLPPQRALGELLLVRPLLDFARADLERYVALRGLPYVDDPSNTNTRLLRNALRQQVIPALAAARPGMRAAAARSITLLGEAAEVLRECAAADLAACAAGAPAGMLRLDRLAQLAPARQALVLRHWLAGHGVATLARARLRDLLTQALAARADAKLLARVGALEIRRHRGLLLVRPAQRLTAAEATVVWHGESAVAVPAWRGVLHFESDAEEGFDPRWLAERPLQLRGRSGGERFKPHPTRPSKTLKRLFQEAGIPDAPILQCDATKAEDVDRLFAQVGEAFGGALDG